MHINVNKVKILQHLLYNFYFIYIYVHSVTDMHSKVHSADIMKLLARQTVIDIRALRLQLQ